MNVGDLVRWVSHEAWDHNGLGFIIETKYDEVVGWKYKIMWHIDIEDLVGYSGMWYGVDDFTCGDIVTV